MFKKITFCIFLIITCLIFGHGWLIAQEREDGRMNLTSPDFQHNTNLPLKLTCDGEGFNPELVIEDLSPGIKSLALVVDDPDAPMGTYVHWVVFDIPVVSKIAGNSVPGKLGVNTSGERDYVSPCPPRGLHRYYFKIYALDIILNLKEGISKGALEKAMQAHIIDKAELIGLCKRN